MTEGDIPRKKENVNDGGRPQPGFDVGQAVGLQ